MTLQCPYHAWTYALDGSLRRAPRAERNESFDPTGIALARVRVDTLGPLVFVNPDPDAPPLAEFFGSWYETVLASGFDFEDVLQPPETHVFEFRSNWKVQIENSLECYHCPTNHPSLARVAHVDEDFWYDRHEWYQRYGGRTRDDALGLDGSSGFYRVQQGPEQDSYLSCLFPNFFFTVQRGHRIASASVCVPVAVDRCLYIRQYCFAEDVEPEVRRDAVAFINQVQSEDVELCATVQRGLASRFYTEGRLLLPSTEAGIAHHERQVLRALADGA
jgi:phenylpropionate dioxygenase-like ring-hydroxylating dioxygenase large terminal subunit